MSPIAHRRPATFKPAPWSRGRFGGNFTGAGHGVRMVGAAADSPMQAGVTLHGLAEGDGLAGRWGGAPKARRFSPVEQAALAVQRAERFVFNVRGSIQGYRTGHYKAPRGMTTAQAIAQWEARLPEALAKLEAARAALKTARAAQKTGVHGLGQDNFSTPEGDAAVEALMAQADKAAADYNAAGDAAYAQNQAEVEIRLAPTKADAPVTAAPTTAPVATPPASAPTVTPVAPSRQPTAEEAAQMKALAAKVGSTVKNLVANYGSLSSAAKVQAAKTEVKAAVANRNAAVANLAATQAAVERGRQTKQVLIIAAVVAGAILLLKG